MFVDRDKNEKMVRVEVLSEKLGQILEKGVVGKKTFAKRSQSKVLVEWTPLARMVVDSPDSFGIEWILKLADELRGDKAAMENEVKASCSDDEDVVWR